MKRDVLLTWLSGLTGAAVGAFGGWWLGVAWAVATPDVSSDPFADIGTVIGTTFLCLVLVPIVFVFLVLRLQGVSRPLLSGVLFVLTSAVAIGLLVRIGTLLLSINIGVQAGAIVVSVIGSLGGAVLTRRILT